MKQKKHFLTGLVTILILLFALSKQTYSQTYIDVAPGYGTLNAAISANTTPNVIFRLQRGSNAIYLLNGTISITIPCRIEAVAGTGSRPQLIPAVVSGGIGTYPMDFKANTTLKGIYITAKDELGGIIQRMTRIMADGVRLTLDDCFMDNVLQAAVRCDNKDAKIYIKNTIVRNCASDWANGRGVDDRGNNIDTLYIENSTFHNIASRVLRDGGGYIKYFYANHNTFTNTGYRLFDIGECPTVVFKNNLIVNCGFLGRGKSGTDALLALNPLTNAAFTGRTQTVEVHHNNVYIDPTFVQQYPDTVIVIPIYNNQMLLAIADNNTGNNMLSSAVEFTSAPPSVSSIIPTYWNDPLLGNSTNATLLRVNQDFAFATPSTFNTYDFKYANTFTSYTAAEKGQPLGALTWFNMTILGVEDKQELPKEFTISQNFPNPFNPTTNIQYSLPSGGMVKVEIFNSIGQKVNTLVNEMKNAGNHQITWNGKNIYGQDVSSGIYFYKVSKDNFSLTKKMMLIK